MKKKPKRLQVRKILSVTDGHVPLGIIEEGATCVARDVDGNKIGVFENRRAAMKAFFALKAPAEAGTLMVEG